MFWAKKRPVPEDTMLFGWSAGSLITLTSRSRRSADDLPSGGRVDDAELLTGPADLSGTGADVGDDRVVEVVAATNG
jgi:hypothetical protein